MGQHTLLVHPITALFCELILHGAPGWRKNCMPLVQWGASALDAPNSINFPQKISWMH
jgi:hypothetical protein